MFTSPRCAVCEPQHGCVCMGVYWKFTEIFWKIQAEISLRCKLYTGATDAVPQQDGELGGVQEAATGGTASQTEGAHYGPQNQETSSRQGAVWLGTLLNASFCFCNGIFAELFEIISSYLYSWIFVVNIIHNIMKYTYRVRMKYNCPV